MRRARARAQTRLLPFRILEPARLTATRGGVNEAVNPEEVFKRVRPRPFSTGHDICVRLPESLKIDGNVQTQTLPRGIYDAAVFRAQVTLSGNSCGLNGANLDRCCSVYGRAKV